jgi:endoglucanase
MKLLKNLIDTHGVSGYESNVREIIRKEIKGHVDSIKTDKFGNLITKKKGKKPTLMLAAHMDEIGIIVKSIHENGKMYLSTIGGFEPLTILGETCKIKTRKGEIYGIISTGEISDDREIRKLPNMGDMFIDTGFTEKELKKLGVDIGTNVDLLAISGFLGNDKYVFGKALDDRIGCYILIELAKRLKKTKNETYFTFTVQEEVGMYGAATSAYNIDADWAIAVDVVNTNDSSKDVTKTLGKGPIVTIKDAEMITNKNIDEYVKKIAKKYKIPIQLEVSDFGTTDALEISLAKGGIPTTVIGVAVRNVHTMVGIAHKKDIKNCIRLLEAIIKNPPKSIKTG